MAAADGPPPPIEDARATHLAETEQLAGRGPEVARVRDDEAGGVPVRIYEPEHADGTVAYLHGGGWVVGNLESVDAVCRALANESRARVVSIDYRLAPEHPFPAALEDALAATRATQADVVAGDSAGGNLAAVVARHLREQIRLQLLVYPVTDAGAVLRGVRRRLRPHRGLDAALLAALPRRCRRPAARRVAAVCRSQRRPAGLRPHRQPRRPARRGRGLRAGARTRRDCGHAQPQAEARSTASGAGRRRRSRAAPFARRRRRCARR